MIHSTTSPTYLVVDLSVPGLSKATARLGETFLPDPKHFHGAPLGENFWFLFKWYILAYFIFLADGGAPKRRGAWNSLPPTPPFRRACSVLLPPTIWQGPSGQVDKRRQPTGLSHCQSPRTWNDLRTTWRLPSRYSHFISDSRRIFSRIFWVGYFLNWTAFNLCV